MPQVSSIWSADPAELWSFPASFLAAFLANHGALQLRGRPRWRSVTGGSRRYVERDRRRATGPRPPAVRRCGASSAARRASTSGSTTRSRAFDEVVVAAHADQALALLAAPSAAERDVLGAIPYQANETVLHTDERLLPRRRAARASWNYHLPSEPAGRTTITYDMSRLQSLRADRRFLVTLNRTDAIDPARVIARFGYAHPVYTPRRRRRAGPLGRDQRARPHALLRRLLGLGLPRGRRPVGAARG